VISRRPRDVERRHDAGHRLFVKHARETIREIAVAQHEVDSCGKIDRGVVVCLASNGAVYGSDLSRR
jgi:hypothetical protein